MNKTLTGNWSCQIVFQTKNIKCKTTLSNDVNFEMFWYGMKLVWFCCDLASPKVNCHRLKDGWWQEIERSWKKLKGRSRLFIKYLAQQTSTVGKFFNFIQYKLFWNVVNETLDFCKKTKMLATSNSNVQVHQRLLKKEASIFCAWQNWEVSLPLTCTILTLWMLQKLGNR